MSVSEDEGGKVFYMPPRHGPHEARLTKRQLANYFQMSPRWVELRLKDGMPSELIGGRRRFRLSLVAPWLQARELGKPLPSAPVKPPPPLTHEEYAAVKGVLELMEGNEVQAVLDRIEAPEGGDVFALIRATAARYESEHGPEPEAC